jgi:hypothetical protein
MQTLAFFLGLVFSSFHFIIWINTLVEAAVTKQDKEIGTTLLIVFFLGIFSWTWLFYLTH